jgi:hypothetical protein
VDQAEAAEIRDHQARLRRADRLTKRDKPTTIKDAAYEVMEEAYEEASGDGAGGHLPVKPRQIMYRARPSILEATGKEKFDDNNFTQKLLIGYMREHPEETASWDIIWDDRGHFTEPHTDYDIGLGTLPVREYIASFHAPMVVPISVAEAHVRTSGPEGRFGAVFFNEKEGFEAIFQAAGVYERYDLAPMSSKGMSTTAARTLFEELCGKRDLPLFVLTDFDIAGFSIFKTLTTDTERYEFDHELRNVIRLGLRLDDIRRFEADGEPLGDEPVYIGEDKLPAIRERLRINGATEEEIVFLTGDGEVGPRRVELNALTSAQLIQLVEVGLQRHGVGKVIPAPETLAVTYVALKRGEMAREAIAAEIERLNAVTVDVPADLVERVRAYHAEHPQTMWDDAIKAIIEER